MAAHAAHVTDARSYTPPPALDRLAGTSLLVGLAGLAVLVVGGLLSALRVLPFDRRSSGVRPVGAQPPAFMP